MQVNRQEQRFGQLLELIYDSVHDIGQIVPAMRMMCDELGAAAGHYVHMNMASREVMASLISDATYAAGDAEYKAYYSGIDARLGWVATGGLGEWRADHQRFDEQFVQRSEIYNDFLFKYGVRHQVVGRIGGDARGDEGISFLRPLGASPYGEREFLFLQSVGRHWTRSSQLRQRLQSLEQQQVATSELLERLPYGVAWVTGNGSIDSMSPVAADMLAVADGLRVRDLRLVADDTDLDRALAQALKQATVPQGRCGQWLAIGRRRSAAPLLVSVLPTRRDVLAAGGQPLVLLILQDMGRQQVPRGAVLAKVFGLTPAEGRLAEALLANETIESYAHKAAVSRNTVRTHLANLFAKTGTRRQAELLRMLLLAEPQVRA